MIAKAGVVHLSTSTYFSNCTHNCLGKSVLCLHVVLQHVLYLLPLKPYCRAFRPIHRKIPAFNCFLVVKISYNICLNICYKIILYNYIFLAGSGKLH